eukprot:3655146-Ditylum_brightwellii.AAC.1
MEMTSQAYEEFSNLFTSELFGPERAFQATAILKQPPGIRRLWPKATESELGNLISSETFKLE